jgi:hypothetical protein
MSNTNTYAVESLSLPHWWRGELEPYEHIVFLRKQIARIESGPLRLAYWGLLGVAIGVTGIITAIVLAVTTLLPASESGVVPFAFVLLALASFWGFQAGLSGRQRSLDLCSRLWTALVDAGRAGWIDQEQLLDTPVNETHTERLLRLEAMAVMRFADAHGDVAPSLNLLAENVFALRGRVGNGSPVVEWGKA